MISFVSTIILLLIARASGSAGDSDYDFVICRRKCYRNSCPQTPTSTNPLPVLIDEYNNQESFSFMKSIKANRSILAWPCLDQCTYQCSQKLTYERMQSGLPPNKFFGHWPFIRWYGLEEPASAAFSALNAISHIVFLCGGYLPLSPASSMRFYVNLYAIIALNAWIASIMYHSQKKDFSSLYDYVSALLLLLYGCTVVVVRILSFPVSPVSPNLLRVLSIALTFLVWIVQAYRLANGHVNHTQHMQVCIALLALSFALYVLYSLLLLRKVQPNRAYTVIGWCFLTQIWLGGAGLLEVFDFPPLQYPLPLTLDPHALWHLLTIPLGLVWYRFWKEDAILEKECSGAGDAGSAKTQ